MIMAQMHSTLCTKMVPWRYKMLPSPTTIQNTDAMCVRNMTAMGATSCFSTMKMKVKNSAQWLFWLIILAIFQIRQRKQSLFRNATNGFPAKWHPWETSAEIPYWWSVNTYIWVVLLIGWGKFLANKKHYPDLGCVASAVWNLCAHLSNVISRGNKWWRHEMSAVLSV